MPDFVNNDVKVGLQEPIKNREINVQDFPESLHYSIYRGVNSKEKLDAVLVKEKNEYHKFILEKQSPAYVPFARIERHHIIPLHCGGLDEFWNIIHLSFDDHTHAHELLSTIYNSKKDQYTVLWRKGLDGKARELQREYARTKSVFLDSEQQAKFGRRGGKKKSEKRDQVAIARQAIEIQKAFSNGTLWHHIDTNIFITIKGGKCKFIRELIDEFSQRVPSIVNKSDPKQIKLFQQGLSQVLKGLKREYCGFYLIGIILEPFVNFKNFHLERYYKANKKKISKFSSIDTTKKKRKAIGSDLGNRSQSFELKQNLNKKSYWVHESDPKKVIKLKPIYANVKEVTAKLGQQIGLKYSAEESKQFSALIKNEWVGRVRRGWTLIQLGDKSLNK